MRSSRKFQADNQHLNEMLDFVRAQMETCKIKKKDRLKVELIVEEAAGSLIEHKIAEPSEVCSSDTEITIIVKKNFGTVSIEMYAKGEKYSLSNHMSASALLEDDGNAGGIQDTLRDIILGSLADGVKYHFKNGVNSIKIAVNRSRHLFLIETLGALLIAILLGALFSSFVPKEVNTFLTSNILIPIKTMYMNALKMVVAPVVFFSIVSCIVQFSDLSELGRIGYKIMGIYLFTTFAAVGVGLLVFFVIKPGDASLIAGGVADATSITSQTINVSIKDTIVGIIPDDYLDPFVQSNMLQLIFLALITGIGAGLIGKYSAILKEIFQALNQLFLKITSLIIKFMPIAVFCSVMSMMITLGIKTILSLLGMLGTFVLGLFIMMCVYCLLILILGRENPLHFVRKYVPSMLQVFSMASSNASIPINMDACEKKLGIDKKIYTLSIPLGATVNMDGTCVYMAVFALTLARVYGVEITGAGLASVIVSIIVLSIGAPGIPGAGLICLSVLLTQLNVPVEAVGLVMGIDALCGMFRAMSNSTGDVAASLIVAKSEKLLDRNKYRS